MRTTPSRTLWEKTKQLTGVVVVAVELFGAPATVHNAIEYYGGFFEQQSITIAPADDGREDVVIAEIEDPVESA